MAIRKLAFAFKLASLLTVFALALPGCARSQAATDAAPPPPKVTVAEVIARPLEQWGEFIGRLEAAESVEIRPRVGGFVDSLHFTEGARVKKGQLLFQIDPRPLQAEVNRLAAELEQRKAALELATANAVRAERLFAEKVITEQELDRLRAEASTSRSAVGAARAALEAARLNLEFSQVRAPIAGRASRALIRPGNLVTSASLLATIVSEEPIHAYFDADEQTYLAFSARAKEGEAPSVFLGLINEQGYPHEGRLDFLDNRLDPKTGTIRARASFANSGGAFTPGLFARLKLALSEPRPSILIEDRAVGTDLGKRFVLVLKSDETVDYRSVELGPLVDGLRVVESGLVPGEVIVKNGLSHVRPGMRITPALAPMQSKPSGTAAAAAR
jgi:multidrug efflux system membrane fusion protein